MSVGRGVVLDALGNHAITLITLVQRFSPNTVPRHPSLMGLYVP